MALLGQSAAELTAWVQVQGQPSYRGQQLHQWLYQKGARSLAEITVFPKHWREEVAAVEVGRSQIYHHHWAKDGTLKLVLGLADGETIETVGIPTGDRLTVCVSSQVGCPMACDFCATGKGGYRRNLAVHEILDQVLTIQSEMQRRVSHVVFMGMGEPLLNLEAVLQSIASLNRDIGIGQRHITLSTVGIPHQIERLASYGLQTTLAVSLHAPNQELRQQLIPSAQHYPLGQLMTDCRTYVQRTGRRVTFEYTLLAEVNDRPQHAQQLAALLRGFQSHVNLIPYNPISEAEYQRPTGKRLQEFLAQLKELGVAASLRRSRGLDRDAACGQLRQIHMVATP